LLQELILEKHFALAFVQLTQLQQSLFIERKRAHEELTGLSNLEQLLNHTFIIFVLHYFN